MEPINPNILAASLGEFVSGDKPLADWPDQYPAYKHEINPEDIREGMECISHIAHSHALTQGRHDSLVETDFGTITSVQYKPEDAYNTYLAITHHLVSDNFDVQAARQYVVNMVTNNWETRGTFYQAHRWLRVQPDVLENLPFAGVEGLILQSHRWDGETIMSLTIDSISEDNWLELQETHKLVGDKGALYWLYPKPSKILRQAEAIPPMPGEKPQPGGAQPGEQPGDGGGKPEGDPNDDIPPMPGESRQSVDKDKKGPTVQLEDGWWGTGRGEN